LQPFVGQYGKQEIEFVLRRSSLTIIFSVRFYPILGRALSGKTHKLKTAIKLMEKKEDVEAHAKGQGPYVDT
jgi:hypothetical protein